MKKSIFMTIFFICLLALGGCSQPNPEDIISSCFNDIKKGDLDNMKQYFVSEENKFNKLRGKNEEIYKQAFKKIDYQIIDSNIDGQTATVKTKIMAPDIPNIMGSLMYPTLKSNPSNDIEKVINDKIIQMINSKDMPIVASEIDINLRLVNKKWLIVPDSSFIRSITGNFINIIDKN
ncbi:hypothetical protein [Wukongibacter sp. M2B1]|uniref:hypothetical protein n=1 Tax=Wukongibacter sp. M2B1 TaxID=3088895 RepID=UPI003D79D1F7